MKTSATFDFATGFMSFMDIPQTDRAEVLVLGANVLVAADAEGRLQQAGGHADPLLREILTQLPVGSAYPLRSSPAFASAG
jgi:hypothetical protein